VAFFDDAGRPLSKPELTGTLRTGSPDVPMVGTDSTDVVLNLDGRQLLELPASRLMPYARLIGTKLVITTDDSKTSMRQYDLATGAAGKTCEIGHFDAYYIASDGEVAVLLGGDGPAQTWDLTTCDALWSLPAATEREAKEVWKVNATLVQRTNDELMSLVAPT
jgi:hypothetical protein